MGCLRVTDQRTHLITDMEECRETERGCVRSTSRSMSECRLELNFQPSLRPQRAATGPTDTVAVRERC
jgi:hypothetical protein